MISFKLYSYLICFLTALPMLLSSNLKNTETKLKQKKNTREQTKYKTAESLSDKQTIPINSTALTADMESRRFYDPENIKDPSFQKLLEEYRNMVNKYSKPANEETDNNQKLKKVRAVSFRANNDVMEQNRRDKTANIIQGNTFIVTSATESSERLNKIRLIKGHRPKWAMGAVRQGFGPGGPGGGMGGSGGGMGMLGGMAAGAMAGGMAGGMDGAMGAAMGGGMGGGPAGKPGEPPGKGPGSGGQQFPNRPTGQAAQLPGEVGHPPRPGEELTMPGSGAKKVGGNAAARFTTPPQTTTKKRRRTTPPRVSFEEDCDYVAYYCLKAYDTGQICGRTMYNTYSTFKNYCMLDFVNCMERYEVWQVVHMGECFELQVLTEYLHYPYLDDYFLDQYYVLEDI